MSSIDKINHFKEKSLRCYYIDSDGDEVIVSDEEDFEVAIDYVKSKGPENVKIFKCERQDESDEEEKEVQDPDLNSKSSLRMVDETVSVDGDIVFDSSDDSDNEVKEIGPGDSFFSNPKDQNESEDSKQFEGVGDTVSRESSMWMNQKELNALEEKEKVHFNSIAESVIDRPPMNISGKVESNPSEIHAKNDGNDVSESVYYSQFDIIQSQFKESVPKVHDYMPQFDINQNKLEKEIAEIDKSSESNSEEHDEILEKELEPEVLQTSEINRFQDEQKVEMNKNISQDRIHENLLKEDDEERKLMELNSSVEESQPEWRDSVISEIKYAEDVKEEDDDEEEKQEFIDKQRVSVSMSCAKANIINQGNNTRVNILQKAIESVNFIFKNPNKRQKIAQVDNTEEEKSQDYVISCKPGKFAKKRWRIVNNSGICWPKNVTIEWQQKEAEVEVPMIKTALKPGEKMDVSINIKISEDEKENVVKVFVFRFNSRMYGPFGEPLIATVEIIPDLARNHLAELSQEEKLNELMEGDDLNPILYEIANDFVEEGLGNFEQCLDALIQCRSNYEEAKQALLKNHEDVENFD